MPKVSVEVDGLRDMVRDLEKAGVEVTDLKEVFSRIADEGADTGRGFTPKKSGALASSVRGNKAKNKAVVTWGKARTPYAGPILYGWPKRGIKGSRTTEKTDGVMDTRAPQMLEEGISDVITKYGFN